MVNTVSTVVGELVLKALPELQCFTNFNDFLKQLPALYAVEVPSTVTNVIVSPSQPTSNQTSSVWIRMSNASQFYGLYVFSEGQWIQIVPAPQQVIWMYGDSQNPDPGYKTTDAASGVEISATLATALKALWIAGTLAPPSYEYYSVILS
jgi:hypothetical protein